MNYVYFFVQLLLADQSTVCYPAYILLNYKFSVVVILCCKRETCQRKRKGDKAKIKTQSSTEGTKIIFSAATVLGGTIFHIWIFFDKSMKSCSVRWGKKKKSKPKQIKKTFDSKNPYELRQMQVSWTSLTLLMLIQCAKF